MNTKVIKEDNRTIVEVVGRIDTITTADFQAQVLEQIPNCSGELILDFMNVEYISSAGLRSLLIIAKTAKAQDSSVILCNLQNIVQEVLEISGFDSFFEVRYGRDQ